MVIITTSTTFQQLIPSAPKHWCHWCTLVEIMHDELSKLDHYNVIASLIVIDISWTCFMYVVPNIALSEMPQFAVNRPFLHCVQLTNSLYFMVANGQELWPGGMQRSNNLLSVVVVKSNFVIYLSVWCVPNLFRYSYHCECRNQSHWGRLAHICISKLTIIGSDNSLVPGQREAIIWTNAGILLTGPLGTNFSELLIKIHIFSSK